ncbi:MAG: four helix bundle protein [Acidobacteriaceae bacterium]|nr:four helix bundle protein [Acidobacteriaceae bacterium]
MAESFRELIVWQRSIELSLAVYKLTAEFPKEEMYGLTSQMRRASVSIASNIAEGYGRGARGEYRQFLGIARGSLLELQTQLVIANELGYCELTALQRVESLSDEVSRMLSAMLRKL